MSIFLYLRRVHFVVLRMGSNKTDVDDPVRIVDLHHEAVFVPPDVEAYAVVFEDTGVGIVPFHSHGTTPIRGAGKLSQKSSLVQFLKSVSQALTPGNLHNLSSYQSIFPPSSRGGVWTTRRSAALGRLNWSRSEGSRGL